MIYRNVNFRVEVLGLNTWRWTILPRSRRGLSFVGQISGTYEQAIDHCKVEIDKLLETDGSSPTA
jgi:hypothetical protein